LQNCDVAVADVVIDKSVLEAMALVEAEHGKKEAKKEGEAKKKRNRMTQKALVVKGALARTRTDSVRPTSLARN
jgi:hypothetical protein